MSDQPKFGEWQPIETAPKDRWILVSYDEIDCAIVRWYEYFKDWRLDDYDISELPDDPTHWMPLPDHPFIETA